MRILNSRRNSSSPGINMIPYRVYKKCPQICSFLFNIFGLCLKHCFVPVQWRVPTEVYIPKAKPPNPNIIKDFRPISLLNVEGKLFFSLVSNRLENHIKTNNKLINSSIQKGCMSMVWNELQSSKPENGNLAAVWLDIANAYGVPEHWIKLIRNYYKSLWSISKSASAPSSWHHHLRGILIGCINYSIILFLSAINVVIEYICNCYVFADVKLNSPCTKAFMDDLFLQSSSVNNTEFLLHRCTCVLSWARLSFRASKSRSIVIRNGKVLDVSPFFFW